MSNIVHIYRELPPVDDNDSGGELVIEVRYTISRYYPATGPTYDSGGEPASGGEVEILSAIDADGNEVELTADEISQIEADHEEPDDDADYLRDQRKDRDE